MRRMTKWVSVLLVVLFAFQTVCLAETGDAEDRSEWECYICGGISDWRYCPWCGAHKSRTLVQCPSCLVMYDRDCHYVFCKACGALLNPVDTTGLSDVEALEKRLYVIMLYWRIYNTRKMLNLCSPLWIEQREEPGSDLFFLLQNRSVEQYELVSMNFPAGSDTCILETKCLINKHNGKEMPLYKVTLTMEKVDGEWYMDPSSIQWEELT